MHIFKHKVIENGGVGRRELAAQTSASMNFGSRSHRTGGGQKAGFSSSTEHSCLNEGVNCTKSVERKDTLTHFGSWHSCQSVGEFLFRFLEHSASDLLPLLPKRFLISRQFIKMALECCLST